MSLIISHNTSALNTHRNLSLSAGSMSKAIEKLSSGYKINVGADDPSGLIISEQLRSQISGLERAVRNSSEAYNLIGIAEGALNEMNTILKKMRALAIHASNSGITSPEQVAADQAEMDSGIETLNRIANTTRYSDQYLLNGSKELVYDITTVVNEPTDHALLDTKLSRVDQIFKRDGVKMSVGYTGEKSRYQANTATSAQRAYLEADSAYSLSEVKGATVTQKQEFILTGTSGSRLFSFAAGAHIGTIVEAINNVRDSTGIGATLTFASDVRIDQTVNGTKNGSAPDYGPPPVAADPVTGYSDGTYVYRNGDVQIYGAGLNDPKTAKIDSVCLTPDASSAFKVGYNCDGDGKIYAKVIDKSTNSIEYYKDRECTMLIGKGDDKFFAAANNSGIPSSPTQNLDGLFIKLNEHNVENQDVFEIGVVGQRLDNLKDMNVSGLPGWVDVEHSVMSGVNLGYNTSPTGDIYYRYSPVEFHSDGKTVKTFRVEAFSHASMEPRYLVAASGIVTNNMNAADPGGEPILDATGNPVLDEKGNPKLTEPQIAGQTVRLESVLMNNGLESGLTITLSLPKPGAVMDAVGKSEASIRQSPEYQALVSRLQTEAGGKRSEVIAREVSDAVKVPGSVYETLTSARGYVAAVDGLVGEVVEVLNGFLGAAGANAQWSSIETQFKGYLDSQALQAGANYQALKNAGYETEVKKLIDDTLAAVKSSAWTEGGYNRNHNVSAATIIADLETGPNKVSGFEDYTMQASTNAVVEDIFGEFQALLPGGASSWDDIKAGMKSYVDGYVNSNRYKNLDTAGYKTLVDNLIAKTMTDLEAAATADWAAVSAPGYTAAAFIADELAAETEYTALATQNQQAKAETLIRSLVGQGITAAAGATSWQQVENSLRAYANNNANFIQIRAAGFGAEINALVADAVAMLRVGPSGNNGLWQNQSLAPSVNEADILTIMGNADAAIGSDAYKTLLVAGDRSVQPHVDQLIDNAVIQYESIIKSGGANWQTEVRNAFQQSKFYADSSAANQALLDSIADDMVVALQNAADNDGYNQSIFITEQMDEMLRGADKTAKSMMPEGEQVGNISFINLGMRVYSMDYGSAETIRIQNKAGNLFYQYREASSMEKVMVKSGTTVQVSGQDAEISLNGAPVFTTGLIANTTTPDFSGTLVFNKGKLGLTTLAVAGYDEGKLFSKATSLQGVEENEPEIIELRRHFEPPALTVPIGRARNATAVPPVEAAGLLNENGQPINLYIDFSKLDPTVQVKIQNLSDPAAIKVSYDGSNILIDATALGGPDLATDDLQITVPVNPDALSRGITVENPALKGLFLRTNELMDKNKSAGYYTVPAADVPAIQAGVGNIMLEVTTYATNPRSNTNEDLTNFLGGMQFQLGNTEGDQDRTIYSIQSMSMSNLGRITYNGQEYCLQNVLGGGSASLTKDPILSMRVLAKAVDDVSTLRARLGAFQSNMLQTNINNLEVSIENITKTESAIRDTDMAEESTQFTRFQIMQQAGTSMLAQANQVSQNVLSLLQ